ncbi:MAG: mannose-1-phosphate guanylyltransferase [bacterium]
MLGLIMAGGSGTRFWPRSRQKHPKQLLKIFNEKTMIQNTVERLQKIVPTDRLFIVSTQSQIAEIKNQLPFLNDDNLIVEPRGKNTAPCIGLSALFMERVDPDGVMVVLPADHLIENARLFLKSLKVGAKVAQEQGRLVTIGIEPTFPATGYGYIQFNEEVRKMNGIPVCKVKTFAEKPNLATAKRFLKTGDFLWNSGIFVWKIKAILREIEEYLPHVYDGLMEIRKYIGTEKQDEVIKRVYCQIKSISIDYGVMEHAKDVMVLRGSFGWNDLGSWDEVYKLLPKDKNKNVLLGKHIIKDGNGCFIDANDKLVAVVGLDNLIIVDTEDAILICDRKRAQDVKEIVDIAKRKKLSQYL